MTERLTITRLGQHGDGIADGPTYVAGALPGETVEGMREGDRLLSPRILTPAPERVTPPCPHARSCGGCVVQHVSDDAVAGWKTDLIRTALAAHGLDAPLRPIATSPPRSRRRATLAGRRTKKGALVGFHARRSDTIVALRDCQVLTPALLACLPALDRMARLGASRSATLAFALTETETGIDCRVTGGKPLDPALAQALPGFRETFTRLTWDDETVLTDAAPALTMGPARLSPPPGAFLQATREGERALLAATREAVGEAARIADLFAGCGTFTLPLSTQAHVHAVESDAAALHALDHAARHSTGTRPVTTEARDLFRRPLLPEDLSRFDAAVIDPPRAGAEAQIREIAQTRIPRIAMISCNPASFARDCAILTGAGYRLDWIQPVDQFRWSSHVELAAALSLPDA